MCDECPVAKDIFGNGGPVYNHNNRACSDNAHDFDWTFVNSVETVQQHIAQTQIESRIHTDRD